MKILVKQKPKKEQVKEKLLTNSHKLVRKAHDSEIAEDYVEMINELIETKGEARAVDISKRLGVTHVTVIKTVARLQKRGLVTSKPYRSIFLTEEGKQMAKQSKERHEIVFNFLLKLGVPEEVAILDAEGIEHHVSKQTLKVFKEFSLR